MNRLQRDTVRDMIGTKGAGSIAPTAYIGWIHALLDHVDALEAQLDQIYEAQRDTMAEPCPGDMEQHCTCVPLLRGKCQELKAQLSTAREALESYANKDNWADEGEGSWDECQWLGGEFTGYARAQAALAKMGGGND